MDRPVRDSSDPETLPAARVSTPTPTPDELMELGDGMIASWALQVAATLGLADHLAGGPLEIRELAVRSGTDADALRRLLAFLGSLGVVRRAADDLVELAEGGIVLRSDVEGSLRQWFVMNGAIWRVFADAPLDSLVTGRPAFDTVFGAPFFEHAQRDPGWGAAFDEAMTGAAHGTARAVTDAYDFSAARRIVDIGGGRGQLVLAILDRNPNARAVVFDLPHVAERARVLLEQRGLATRVEVIGGDFFDAVPEGGDVYLLAWILHDWDDERATAVLRSCRAAIPPDGRLLVVEMCVPAGHDTHPSRSLDMVMLVAVGGRERMVAEYRRLLAAAGFRLERVIPTASPMSILEARPVDSGA